jgi:DNA polymerase/3'-5' exonuclease PolX
MIKHDSYLSKINKKINKLYPNTTLTVVGSYRREKTDSGDIDVLITNKDNNKNVFNYFLELLEQDKYITTTLSHGIKKFMGMCILPKSSINRRLDVLYTTSEEYPFALLYFTGSGNFNTTLREYANTIGYRLNEYAIRHYNYEKKIIGDIIDVPFKNETDIFKFFKIPFIEPKEREKSILEKLLPTN